MGPNISLTASLLLRSAINKALAPLGLEVMERKPGLRLKDIPESCKVALSNQFRNYHVGSGNLLAESYLNIDMVIEGIEGRPGMPMSAKGTHGPMVMIHDLRHGIPARDGTLDIIYHSHFLEHLSNIQGEAFLRDCYRCLAPGGSMRLAVPDFRLWCQNYVAANKEFFEWYRNAFLNWWTPYHNHATIFGGMLYNYGHQMDYDCDSLCSLLSLIGFTDIQQQEWGEGDGFPALSTLESQDSFRKFESLVLQCSKTKA